MKAYFYNQGTCTRVKLYGLDVIELFKVNGWDIVDDALDACEYNIQARNNLAVCFNEYSQNLFKNEFENSIDDIDAQYFDIFFKNIQYIF